MKAKLTIPVSTNLCMISADHLKLLIRVLKGLKSQKTTTRVDQIKFIRSMRHKSMMIRPWIRLITAHRRSSNKPKSSIRTLRKTQPRIKMKTQIHRKRQMISMECSSWQNRRISWTASERWCPRLPHWCPLSMNKFSKKYSSRFNQNLQSLK